MYLYTAYIEASRQLLRRWYLGHDSHQNDREHEWFEDIRTYADLASLIHSQLDIIGLG